jgi:hypothetical protein
MKYKKPKWSFQFYKTYQFEWKPIYRNLPELMWKDKFDSPRCEMEPYYRFEWLWFGFRAQQGDDDEWCQWLWVHEYNDGDVEKAKQTWGWVDYETKESTWNNEYGK